MNPSILKVQRWAVNQALIPKFYWMRAGIKLGLIRLACVLNERIIDQYFFNKFADKM